MTAFFNVDDCREQARRRMPRMIFDALDGATGNETASRRNRAAFEDVCLQGRVLVNVESRTLKNVFLGHEWQVPFGIAPMGMCDLFWPGSDQAMARAARELGFPLGVSTMSSTTLEQLFDLAGGNAWFQLYAGESDELTHKLVERAARAGYETLILTADVPALAPRQRDQRNGFKVPFRIGPRQFIDFACHPRWAFSTLKNGKPQPRNVGTSTISDTAPKKQAQFRRESGRGRFDWHFLSELRAIWPHKLVLKGVMCAPDAQKAADAGVDAIYVSNHGGRQLDSAPAAIEMLPLVREALGSEFPIVFDSGVRSGEDIARTLASGADFALLGRPFLYAMGAGGSVGLAQLLKLLTNDLSTVMAQLGCINPVQLNDAVRVSVRR
ncbi:MAG: alpha-hydroxy-acid oxidizing protein [Proteobacteria bacterium]|nr:alpha-hydroxy-acid oxidizing protein [Pseudomonadota bacterium]HJP06212.1 alpha-hydroxy acid oxidase [Arenicellales bacterium]